MKTCRRCRLPMVKSGNVYMCRCGNMEKVVSRHTTRNIGRYELIDIRESGLGGQHLERLACSMQARNCRTIMLDSLRINGKITVAKFNAPIGYLKQLRYEEWTYQDVMRTNPAEMIGKDIIVKIPV